MRTVSRAAAVVLVAVALLFSSSLAPTHAAERTQPRDPDGTYTGRETPAEPHALDALDIGFTVAKDGRRIKGWSVTMNVICGLDVKLIAQSMPTMKVRRSGRFHSVLAGTLDNGTTYRVEVGGKLVAKKRKVTLGTLSYVNGSCRRGHVAGSPLHWSAKRTGR